MRSVLRIALVTFFLSPILIWLVVIKNWSTPGFEWIVPLGRTFLQASLSALISVVLGVLMAMGALSLKSPKTEKFLEFWLLIPNLIPQLFLILAVLNLGFFVPFFRPGLPAVVITHSLLNCGLIALALLRLFGSKLSGFLDLAVVEGATRRMIWFEVIVPSLKSELLFLFLFVFSVCLTSFSIPLVLGGPSATNFEILIYETLRMNADWSRALYYAVIQIVVLSIFVYLIPKSRWSWTGSISRWQVLGLKRFVPLAIAPSALLLTGWLIGVISSLRHLVPEDLFFNPFTAALNTMIVAMGVGFLTLWLCLWISYVWPNPRLAWFMKSYLTPSNAITGFALLLLPGQSTEWPLVKMIVALTLVSFPLLFRWLGQAALESLEEQIAVARTLGASWSQILFEIIWPERAPVFFRMAALSSLWASGDFALSSIMAEGHRTWALWIESLINSYRLDLASLLTIPLFALGLICYAFFVGAGRYVTR